MNQKIDIAYFLRNLKKSFDKRVLWFSFRIRRMLVKQDTYIFFDCLYSKITEEIDALTLFEYCRKNGVSAVYVAARDGYLYKQTGGREGDGVYFVEDEKENWLLRKELFSVVSRTSAVITSFGDIYAPLEKFFRKGQNIEYIFIGHGPTFLKISHLKDNYMSSKRYNRILISNEYEGNILLNYGWQEEQFIKAGMPRWDRLVPGGARSNNKKIFIFFSWRKTFGESTISFDEFEYVKKLKTFLSSPRLKSIKNEYGVDFYVGTHHALLNQCGSDLRSIITDNVKLVPNDQVSRCIAKSSMLLTDFSSIFVDFYLQNKPVIFYWLDESDEKLNEYDKEDFKAMALRTPKIYNVIKDEAMVFDRLEYYIKQDFRMDIEEREKAEAFFYTKEKVCEKIMEQIKR